MEAIINLSLGGREYELLPLLRPGEESVTGEQLDQRARQLNAQLGEEDANWFIAHQTEIPAELEQFGLIFSEWRLLRKGVPCLRCRPARWWRRNKAWVIDWYFAGSHGTPGDGRIVRRVK